MAAQRRLSLATAALLGAVVVPALTLAPASLTGTAWAAPQPDPVPRRWELQVDPGALRATVVDAGELGKIPVLYMTYRVANLSNEELYLAPLWELATDEGDILRSGRGVPADVYRTLLERLKNPFLQDEIAIQGTIRPGRENTRQGLVVWLLPGTDMDELSVYGAGFSGETRAVTRPDTGEKVILRKTLMLRHPVPGEIDAEINPTFERSTTQWILR